MIVRLYRYIKALLQEKNSSSAEKERAQQGTVPPEQKGQNGADPPQKK